MLPINIEALKNSKGTSMNVLFHKRNISIILIDGENYILYIRHYPKPSEQIPCATYIEAFELLKKRLKRKK